MKTILKALIVIIISVAGSFSYTYSQMNNFWVQGADPWNAGGLFGVFGMDFRNGQITYTSYQNTFGIWTTEASICDSAGNLLFYTNGLAVVNAQHDTMVNGDNLSPGIEDYWWPEIGEGLPQAVIILPFPGDPNKYCIIHSGSYTIMVINDDYCDTLYYSIVDMQQDSGRGAVTLKNQHLWVGDAFASDLVVLGGITACKHANGRDWWIVTHKDSSNMIMSFLLTPQGFQGPFLQAIGPLIKNNIGPAAFSPDGTKYAFYTLNHGKKVRLFDFDRCTGTFSNVRAITNLPDTTIGSVGISFSPNSRYLYTSSFSEINQFDTWAANVPASKTLVAVTDTFTCPTYLVCFFHQQLASDGKIYISSCNGNTCFSVINFPDSGGVACQAVPHGLSNLPHYNYSGVPNYPNYYLNAVTGSACDSLTGIKSLEMAITQFNVQPNPNKGIFTISYQLPQNKNGFIEIFNTLGEVILKEPLAAWSSSYKIDIEGISEGIYLSKITSGGRTASLKFVVY